jgi:hypothetical protein
MRINFLHNEVIKYVIIMLEPYSFNFHNEIQIGKDIQLVNDLIDDLVLFEFSLF